MTHRIQLESISTNHSEKQLTAQQSCRNKTTNATKIIVEIK